jgi:hypothetical protein
LADELFVARNTHICSARELASAILQAWGANNPELLERNLASAEAPVQVSDTGEGERREVLAAIAAEMRQLLQSDQFSPANPHLPLLQHLASAPRSYGYAYCC